MPKGLPDLLVWIMDSNVHNKTPPATVVTSPKKREILALQSLYFRPHLAQSPRVSDGHKATIYVGIFACLFRGRRCWGVDLLHR